MYVLNFTLDSANVEIGEKSKIDTTIFTMMENAVIGFIIKMSFIFRIPILHIAEK